MDSNGTGLVIGLLVYIAVLIAVTVLYIVANWKIFTKAGEAGWKCLIPFYNGYVMFKIATGKGWMYFLMFIPIVNIVLAIMFIFKLAKAFGYSTGFGFGLLFLAPIFYCILAFGNNEYIGA